jgi:hypothetical protein
VCSQTIPAEGQQSVLVAAGYANRCCCRYSSGDGSSGTQQKTTGENSPVAKQPIGRPTKTASKVERCVGMDICGPWPEYPQLCEYGLRHAKGKPPSPIRADQLATAIEFLRHFRPTKKGTYSSYFLKHEAERWGGRNGMCTYVSNGALIAAALHLGLVIDEYGNCWPTSPNAKIGISKRDFVKLMGYSMNTSIDNATGNAALYRRRLCAHEAGGHAFVARALGSVVEYVTAISNGRFAGHCMRRGAPSAALALIVEDATDQIVPAWDEIDPPTVVDVCAKIGSPQLGDPRVEYAEEAARAMTLITELVAGRVCEKVLFPDHEPLSADHDFIEARALASVISAAPDALLRFAEAEAEALIRAHLGVVTALVDALVEHGTLHSEQIDRIISDTVAGEMLASELLERQRWSQRTESAAKFRGDDHCTW